MLISSVCVLTVVVASFSTTMNHKTHNHRLQQQQHQQLLLQFKENNQRRIIQSSSPSSAITTLRGLLDEMNSDAYNLMSTKSDADDKVDLHNAYEMLLAELVFSTNDPRVDIMNRFDLATDPVFLEWMVDKKIESSKDPEERLALKDLYDMIIDIKTRVEVNRLQEERLAQEAMELEQARVAEAEATAATGRTLSNADVIKRAQLIQNAAMIDPNGASKDNKKEDNDASTKTKSFYEEELTPEIRLSYESLVKKVMPPYKAGTTPASIVEMYYDQFDAQFVKVLSELSTVHENADAQSILEALAVEQQKRIVRATEALKGVLSLGDPRKMEGAVIKMVREGKIDEAFLLLLEANENQALAAGATGPAQIMSRIRLRAVEEKDKQSSSKEIALIRKLLRTDDADVRETILEDAFTPRANLLVAGTTQNAMKAIDGEAPEPEKPVPDVPPPDFINACKAVLLNFGNLGSDDTNRGDLATQIRKIAAEAEVVATRIYGKGMSLREQQDQMWETQTTSIFDLETLEIEAERNGEIAPWANSNSNDDEFLMPGFDKDGRMQIGGV
jgi:hypothetical protein